MDSILTEQDKEEMKELSDKGWEDNIITITSNSSPAQRRNDRLGLVL